MVGLADGRMQAISLDYTAVKNGFELAGIKSTPELWSDLQFIEHGAKAAINEE
jgi:hypothetical protein